MGSRYARLANQRNRGATPELPQSIDRGRHTAPASIYESPRPTRKGQLGALWVSPREPKHAGCCRWNRALPVLGTRFHFACSLPYIPSPSVTSVTVQCWRRFEPLESSVTSRSCYGSKIIVCTSVYAGSDGCYSSISRIRQVTRESFVQVTMQIAFGCRAPYSHRAWYGAEWTQHS
jgi:hypothetical protein